MNNKDFSFVSIATKGYVQYLKSLIHSARIIDDESHSFEWVILTDAPHEFNKLKEHVKFQIKTHKIPSLGWPEATLLRYELFKEFFDEISGNTIVYLDADMEISENFLQLIDPRQWDNECALVSHPGYWRPPTLVLSINFYIRYPVILLRDILKYVVMGGLGAWETRKSSSAYVPRNLRKEYVCGGVWMSSNQRFKEICRELSEAVRIDLQKNVTAVWHDESHLNNWATKNTHSLLLPSFCFDATYLATKKLPRYIRAVDKRYE